MRTHALVLFFLISISPALSFASCSSSSCACAVEGAGSTQPAFSLDLSHQYLDQDRARAGTHDVAIGAIPSSEDEVRTINRITSLRAVWRPSPGWALTGTLPYVSRTHEHISNESGSPELLRWSYSGLGDTELWLARAVLGGSGSRGELRVQWGAKLPTGRRNVPEIDGMQPEPPARPGTGSWDGMLGAWAVYAAHAPSPAGGDRVTPVRAMVLGRWNGKGTEEYRVGRELQAHVGADYPLAGRLDLLLQGNLRVRGKDDVGLTDAERENSGGTWAYFTPGLRASVAPGVSVYGLVQIPVYERVNRIQLVSDYNLSLGVMSTIF